VNQELTNTNASLQNVNQTLFGADSRYNINALKNQADANTAQAAEDLRLIKQMHPKYDWGTYDRTHS